MKWQLIYNITKDRKVHLSESPFIDINGQLVY